MAIDKEILDRLDRFENTVANRLGDLELKINEINRRNNPWPNQIPLDIMITEMELRRKIGELNKSSDPYRVNKIHELQLEFNKKYGVPSTHKSNEVLSRPNLDHYYEDGMPRLDKYLAYVELREYGQNLDNATKRLFLLPKDCHISYVTNAAGFGYIEFTICGLVDIKKFERHGLRFKFDTTCPGALMVFMSMFNSLQNGGKLTKECIYGETLNEFRTICFEIDSKCVDATITNTIYSTYGCMEENEPRWEDTIRERAQIIVEP